MSFTVNSEWLHDCRWTVLTFVVLWHCVFHGSFVGLYDEVQLLLSIFQTAALLEVFYILLPSLLLQPQLEMLLSSASKRPQYMPKLAINNLLFKVCQGHKCRPWSSNVTVGAMPSLDLPRCQI